MEILLVFELILSLSKPFMMVSLLLVVGSWVAVATLGMNLGIDLPEGAKQF